MTGFRAVFLVGLLTTAALAQQDNQFEVIVIGGTPGGIGAAVSAGRYGRTVALVERHNHLGAMSSSGLGKSDVITK